MVLVVDPQIAGVSGDMLLCALVDLGADKSRVIDGVGSSPKFLPGSEILEVGFEKNDKNGISSTGLVLEVGEERHRRKGSDIRRAVSSSVDGLGLSGGAKRFAESCVGSLIDAESRVHGIPAESVHFHEAASIDTVVDIVGVAISLEDLSLFGEEVACMPIAVGGGSVTFSHGTTSNPASAVLEILKNSGLAIRGSPVEGELTTPTGACILRNLATSPMDYYPQMEVTATGYGSGKRDFGSFSNVLKLVRGRQRNALGAESVRILETNVDDVSGEVLGNLVERIMERGARDVSIYPGITKKNRPTNLISIMCDDGSMEGIIDAVIGETGTLGIRVGGSDRLVLPRTVHSASVELGGRTFDVRYKASRFKGRTYLKIEFDDLQDVSRRIGMPLRDTESLIRRGIEKEGGK